MKNKTFNEIRANVQKIYEKLFPEKLETVYEILRFANLERTPVFTAYLLMEIRSHFDTEEEFYQYLSANGIPNSEQKEFIQWLFDQILPSQRFYLQETGIFSDTDDYSDLILDSEDAELNEIVKLIHFFNSPEKKEELGVLDLNQ